MKKFKTEHGVLYISDDLHSEYTDCGFDADTDISETLKDIFENRAGFKKYIELFSEASHIEEIAVIDAYGQNQTKGLIKDGDGTKSLQRIIGQLDGNYAAIILHTGTVGNYDPKSRVSLLMVQEGDSYSLIVPDVGEIASSTIDAEVKRLEKAVK